jgi:hypothetical protein
LQLPQALQRRRVGRQITELCSLREITTTVMAMRMTPHSPVKVDCPPPRLVIGGCAGTNVAQ